MYNRNKRLRKGQWYAKLHTVYVYVLNMLTNALEENHFSMKFLKNVTNANPCFPFLMKRKPYISSNKILV